MRRSTNQSAQKVHKKGADIWEMIAITVHTAVDLERREEHYYIFPYHAMQFWKALALRVRR